MTKYPLDSVTTKDGMVSTYALAHILGFTYTKYLAMTRWISSTVGMVKGKYSRAAYLASRKKRLINGWLFVDIDFINVFLTRNGYPKIEDILDDVRICASLIDDRDYDYEFDNFVDNRSCIHEDRRIFEEIIQNRYNIIRNRVVIKRKLYKISRNK